MKHQHERKSLFFQCELFLDALEIAPIPRARFILAPQWTDGSKSGSNVDDFRRLDTNSRLIFEFACTILLRFFRH